MVNALADLLGIAAPTLHGRLFTASPAGHGLDGLHATQGVHPIAPDILPDREPLTVAGGAVALCHQAPDADPLRAGTAGLPPRALITRIPPLARGVRYTQRATWQSSRLVTSHHSGAARFWVIPSSVGCRVHPTRLYTSQLSRNVDRRSWARDLLELQRTITFTANSVPRRSSVLL
jgi:hypothetical protein